MTKFLATSVPMLAIAVGFVGCVEEDYTPTRRPGFNPQTSSAPMTEVPPIPSVDPAPVPLSPLPDGSKAPGLSANAPGSNVPIPSEPPGAPAPQAPVPPTPPPAPAPAPQPAKPAPPYAKKVPGKPNQIYNPFTGAILDVTGLPPGQLVRDPRTGEEMLVP